MEKVVRYANYLARVPRHCVPCLPSVNKRSASYEAFLPKITVLNIARFFELLFYRYGFFPRGLMKITCAVYARLMTEKVNHPENEPLNL